MEITRNQLLSYAPYKLNLFHQEWKEVAPMENIDVLTWENDTRINLVWTHESDHWWMFKPLVRPFTDLIKDIEIEGNRIIPITSLMMGQMDLRLKDFSILNNLILADGFPVLDLANMKLSLEQWQLLMKWHFWVYDQRVFEAGLVIDLTVWENEARKV